MLRLFDPLEVLFEEGRYGEYSIDRFVGVGDAPLPRLGHDPFGEVAVKVGLEPVGLVDEDRYARAVALTLYGLGETVLNSVVDDDCGLYANHRLFEGGDARTRDEALGVLRDQLATAEG